ncbi:DUF2306 domain-containing protein [Hyphobacterium marinum]|uniref:DUF2306 domain-containing protein n=1 Tax=Hyphobacterium marinum TaxID=3116574 RepID=A0ABU7LZG9_9PROT|nr:DUF2306 domain-containing protein [Hyphobacterium sp. Y6023]MEE2566836.1 DUF2306 domain-containing protein [Hyphobacterium sp. Y6023]
MVAIDTPAPRKRPITAHSLLKASAIAWFIPAAIGQWLFAYYVLAAYGPSTATGQWSEWDQTGLMQGYTVGDLIGNLVFISHVLLTAVITVGGTLQLVPPLRKRYPAVHRFTGRTFLIVAVILAVGGIWMIWGRGSRLTDIGGWGTTLNAVLILVAAAIAVTFAVRRQIDRHRRWAMRLFIFVSGVWFTRLGYMAWAILTGGTGMSRSLDGPFDLFIAFGSYLVPWAVLEIYLAASDSRSDVFKLSTAGLTLAATAVTAIGVFGAWNVMWSPHI